MKAGFQEAKRARLERDRARLDREFERNMMIQQKIAGVAIALLAIIAAALLSELYGQFEYFLLALLFVGFGIWLILTKENTFKENRDSLREMGWRTYWK